MIKKLILVLVAIFLAAMITSSLAESSPSVSGTIDWNNYSLEELIAIKDQLDEKITELRIKDAMENGDRKIEFPDDNIILYNGQTQKLEATVIPRIETAPAKTTLVWTSSNPEVVTVANGTIKGVTAGEAIITAAAQDNDFIFSNITVHVRNSANTLTLNTTTADLLLGDAEEKSNVQLAAEVLPEDAFDKSITWSSSDENIVTVSESGRVQAVSAGKAVITATTNDESLKQPKTAKCTVTVLQAVQKLTIEDNLTLNKKGTGKLNPVLAPENASNKKLIYTSSDPQIASVTQNGGIAANACGTCDIICETTDGSELKSTCHVEVIQMVTGIKLSANNLIIKANSQEIVKATVNPQDATQPKLKWSSSNSLIATVENGKIKALRGGDCVVTVATTDGSNLSADIKVHVPVFSVSKDQYSVTSKSGLSIPIKKTTSVRLTMTDNGGSYFDARWGTEDGEDCIIITPKVAGKGSVKIYCDNYKQDTVTIPIIIEHSAVYDTQSYPTITYTDAYRYPNNYKNKNVSFSGRVLQVMEGSWVTVLRVSSKGRYDNVVYVVIDNSEITTPILENDTVTVFGTYDGNYTYETIMGGSVTIPSVDAERINVK